MNFKFYFPIIAVVLVTIILSCSADDIDYDYYYSVADIWNPVTPKTTTIPPHTDDDYYDSDAEYFKKRHVADFTEPSYDNIRKRSNKATIVRPRHEYDLRPNEGSDNMRLRPIPRKN